MQKKPGLGIMVGIGAPKPPKGMAGAPKFPGADADSGTDQGSDDQGPEEYLHCPNCGSKLCVRVAPDQDDSGDDSASPDQSADQVADQDYGQ